MYIGELGPREKTGQYNPKLELERFRTDGYMFVHHPMVKDPGTGEYPREIDGKRVLFVRGLDQQVLGKVNGGTRLAEFVAVDLFDVSVQEYVGFPDLEQASRMRRGGWTVINTEDPNRFIALKRKIGD